MRNRVRQKPETMSSLLNLQTGQLTVVETLKTQCSNCRLCQTGRYQLQETTRQHRPFHGLTFRRVIIIDYKFMIMIGIFFTVRVFLYGIPAIPREFAILACAGLFAVSNQFRLAPLLNDGQKEAEFKELAEWYRKNAKSGEKMGLYMASVVSMFAPEHAADIVRLPWVYNEQGEPQGDPEKFVRACYDEEITYVVWATREGFGDHSAYRRKKLDTNIGFLREPKDNGPYKFVAQVHNKSRRAYVNIFRLQKGYVPES